ncbi:MAG: sulfatase family protein [Planctomycetota bacterium]|jgi:choline-sulfatase
MKKPNILFIMDDQHRGDWLGCSGAHWLKTPNIDKLAERGINFTNCHTNSPICAPARVSLATGLFCTRVGFPNNNCYLPKGFHTYYKHLKDNGYKVAVSGKLHLRKKGSPHPSTGACPEVYEFGFTDPMEHSLRKFDDNSYPEPMKSHSPYTLYLQEKGLLEPLRKDYKRRRTAGWHMAAEDCILEAKDIYDVYDTDRAIEWIKEQDKEAPWHMFVSLNGPHAPYDAPTEYYEHFKDTDIPAPIHDEFDGKPEWQKANSARYETTQEQALQCHRQYAGLIELIDDQVGRLMETLEETGDLDNTYVIFTSDHGDMMGDHSKYAKNCMYEGALRIPLVVAGPGIEGGRVSDTMVSLFDINPTIVDLLNLPEQENLDARSFAPVLRGEAEEHREEIISEYTNMFCVRTKKYKFVRNSFDMPELYDLENDPQELKNILDDNPEIALELSNRYVSRYLEWR